MREIKFRGKCIQSKRWVYGYYFIEERDIEDGIIWRDIPQIQQRYGDHFQYFDVDLATVGQYTGLHDKNGKGIWEGDVIQYQRTKTWGFHCAGGEHKNDTPQTFKGVVSFDNGAFRIAGNFEYPSVKNLSNICTRWKEEFKKCVLDHQQIHQERIGGYDNAFYEGFEVIGNIHDNPELIHDQKAEVEK